MAGSTGQLSGVLFLVAGACIGLLLGSFAPSVPKTKVFRPTETAAPSPAPVGAPQTCDECPQPSCAPAALIPSPPACPSPAVCQRGGTGDANGSESRVPTSPVDDARDFSPFVTTSYLRGYDLHMRAVCVNKRMPYQVFGIAQDSCGPPDFKFHLRNATKTRVSGCSRHDALGRAMCAKYGLYCDVLASKDGPVHELDRVEFYESATLAPMEFWDKNYGHIITDGHSAMAALRAVEVGATSRTRASATGAVAAVTDRSPVFLWRDAPYPFEGAALQALWTGFMQPQGLRFLPHDNGKHVCFDRVRIVGQPLNFLSWHRIASTPFLHMAQAWGAKARLVVWPAGHAQAGRWLEDDAAREAARQVQAATPHDDGLGPLPREEVAVRARQLRRQALEGAPDDVVAPVDCSGGGQRRKPKVLVADRKGKRRVRNMASLVEWFRRMGYDAEAWEPTGSMTAAQQAEAINKADIFVSNHGQAQAWAVMMREDATLVALCSDNQMVFGSCAYYPIAARNSGHSRRRTFVHVSRDSHYNGGQKRTDEQMRNMLKQHGGLVGGEWHYTATHWDDIDVDVEDFASKWAAHLGTAAEAQPDAEAFWRYWCNFDDVINAINQADAESLATDLDSVLAQRMPRLQDGIRMM